MYMSVMHKNRPGQKTVFLHGSNCKKTVFLQPAKSARFWSAPSIFKQIRSNLAEFLLQSISNF